MALLDRVATLVLANLNDLVDKAENPEKILKQVILDMENQYMQVKTQVAIALADLHVLRKNHREHIETHADWMRKADLAVGKQDDELARAALSRALSAELAGATLEQQIADQQVQVDSLKTALNKLEVKLTEARTKADLLIVRHRRSRAANRVASSQDSSDPASTFERMRSKIVREEAISRANGELFGDDFDDRFRAMERNEKIDSLLSEIKAKRGIGA